MRRKYQNRALEAKQLQQRAKDLAGEVVVSHAAHGSQDGDPSRSDGGVVRKLVSDPSVCLECVNGESCGCLIPSETP